MTDPSPHFDRLDSEAEAPEPRRRFVLARLGAEAEQGLGNGSVTPPMLREQVRRGVAEQQAGE